MDTIFANVWDVIEQIKSYRETNSNPIFENGKLKPDIYVCDVVEFLENNCDNAVDTESMVFANVQGMSYNFSEFKPYNNFNIKGKSSEWIEYCTFEDAWDFYVIIAVNLGSNPNQNYTPFVMFRFDTYDEFWDALQQNFTLKTEDFNADISVNALCEELDIYACFYNNKEEEHISFECYDFDKEDIIDSIKNKISKIKSES